ncbi:hypothetical protein SAY87_019221 [Trapa incisa]|uniref:Uncharacterized protein n=1 Tax=Trapa incisa TaxID=236973 RepID=A0AAN7JZK1_9MYRT|nr:hypothetical protein SAY87_019221 [Trapa incisa]
MVSCIVLNYETMAMEEEACVAYLDAGEGSFGRVGAELMHDPAGLLTSRGSPPVEDEGLLHPDQLGRGGTIDLFILAGCLPMACLGGPIRPQPCRPIRKGKIMLPGRSHGSHRLRSTSIKTARPDVFGFDILPTR